MEQGVRDGSRDLSVHVPAIEPLESREFLSATPFQIAFLPKLEPKPIAAPIEAPAITLNYSTNDRAVTVSWDASIVSGELGWRVQRSLDGRDFDHYVNLQGHVDSYTDDDRDLPTGATIYYRVRAYGNDEDTAYSTKELITTPQPVGAGDETISVPLTDTVETSAMTLEAGVDYLLTASGLASNGGAPSDAEYSTWAGQHDDTRTQYDNRGDVDYGIRVSGVSGAGSWGAYQSSGVYSIHVTGEGTPVSFHYGDDVYDDNDGALSVTITRAPLHVAVAGNPGVIWTITSSH